MRSDFSLNNNKNNTNQLVHADLYNIDVDVQYDTILDKEGLPPLDKGEC